MTSLLTTERRLLRELDALQIEIVLPGDQSYMAALQVTSPLVEKIKLQQNEDPELMKIQKGVEEERNKDFTLREDVLWYRNRLCVPNALYLRKELLKEAHNFTLTTYPRITKMYYDLKTHFWCIGLKTAM